MLMESRRRFGALGFAIFAAFILSAGSLRALDWPNWRGPDHNGISKETGWKSRWPAEGPKRLWKASVGTGFSSITVGQGRAFTMGNQSEQDTVYCFDAVSGALLWKHSYPCALDPHFYEGGTSATPTVDGDRVYTVSKRGDLFCFDAAKGNVVWSKDVHDALGAEAPTWGFAGSPLVEGGLLVLNVGGAGTALDKLTGKPVWGSGTNPSGYATPVPFAVDGERRVAIFASQSLEVVRVGDGKTVWSFPWKTRWDINASDPIIAGDEIHISSGCGHGDARLKITDGKPAVVWENSELQTHFSSCILWQGFVYGVHDEGDTSELRCLDWKTGEVKWSNAPFGKGSIMLADGKLIGMSDKGELIVAEPSPVSFKVISRTQVLGGKCWTVPTLANGRIYCRNARGDVVCLDVRGTEAASN
jgi:outer membrane protein assembly factor BamB